MKVNVVLILTIIFFFACKPHEVIVSDNTRVEYIQKLVPIVLPIETASAQAVLECSTEGLVLLSRLNIETSRNAYLNLMLDSIGGLYVDALFRGDTVYMPSDSVIVNRDVVRTEIEYRDRELTKWQEIKQEAGGLAIGVSIALILGAAVYLFLKFKGVLK